MEQTHEGSESSPMNVKQKEREVKFSKFSKEYEPKFTLKPTAEEQEDIDSESFVEKLSQSSDGE